MHERRQYLQPGHLFFRIGVPDNSFRRFCRLQLGRRLFLSKVAQGVSNPETRHNEESAMHILITGGTGLIGQALCHQWAAQGHQLTVWSRRPEQVPVLCGTAVAACAAAG